GRSTQTMGGWHAKWRNPTSTACSVVGTTPAAQSLTFLRSFQAKQIRATCLKSSIAPVWATPSARAASMTSRRALVGPMACCCGPSIRLASIWIRLCVLGCGFKLPSH
ncbi:hypothetical protein LPJ81_004805, partial [Coemansia sp. IMI 209127]